MIISAAQTRPKYLDIEANLLDHYRLIEIAAANGSDLIVFPELSITGYELEKSDMLAFSLQDFRLDELSKLSETNQMIIIAGAPIRINSDLFIGEFILLPDRTITIYTKHFLHSGEDKYYKSSLDYDPIIRLGSGKISFAICADIENPSHPESASKKGADYYFPSIFYSPNGIDGAHRKLGDYAKQYSFNILMSNFCGESMGLPAAGRSAFWNNRGELIGKMNDKPGLLIAENNNAEWSTKLIEQT